MRISDWSSDVCSSDLRDGPGRSLYVDCPFPAPEGRQAQAGRARHAAGWQLHHARGRPACQRGRSEEHTSELQSLMRISYAVFCLKKKTKIHENKSNRQDMKRINDKNQ